ncbi:MAG TPA: rhomboid family intramembrane serine protease [Thermoanaerobaculia bacterium]|nr:rhomboid family intramembrane serine protease [Thermoanaerobaculia bacterium]
MLIVPVGRGESILRRNAWATYALVVTNVLFFLLFCVPSSDQQRVELMHSWRSAVTYLRDRPYLSVPPYMASLVPADLRDRVPRPDPSVPDWRASKEQDEIGEMARDVYERYSAAPDVRMAYIPALREPSTMLTSMFLHGGWMHLAGNMLFLLAIGPFIEMAYGRALFVSLYLTGGIAGALGFSAMHPNLMQPLVGASGAIAALMGAYLFRFALSHIDFLFIPIAFVPMWNYRFSIRAIFILPIWFLAQLVSIPMEGDSGVAVTAHVAGFLYGFAFVLLLRVIRLGRGARPEIAKQPVVHTVELRAALDRALTTGVGESIDAASASLFAGYCTAADSKSAGDLILEMQPVFESDRMPQFLSRAAAFAERTGDRPQAIALFERLCEVEAASANVVPSLVKLAMLRRTKGDVLGAREALNRALSHPHCSTEWRRRVENTLLMM